MPPIVIKLRPSRQLQLLLVALHLAAAGAVWPLTLPWPIRLALVGVLAISWVAAFRGIRRLPVARLHLGSHGRCEIETEVSPRETAEILPHGVVFSGLIVLPLYSAGRRHMLVLLPDSSDADSLRRLRVWLRGRTG